MVCVHERGDTESFALFNREHHRIYLLVVEGSAHQECHFLSVKAEDIIRKVVIYEP